MSQGAEILKTATADATKNLAAIEGALIGSTACEALYQAVTNKKPGRSTVINKTTPDAGGDISVTDRTTLTEVGNSMHVVVNVRTTTAGNSCSIQLAKYDNAASPPLLMGISEASVVTSGIYKDGSSGKYMAQSVLFDIGGASGVKLFVQAMAASESMDFFLSVL